MIGQAVISVLPYVNYMLYVYIIAVGLRLVLYL